MLAVPELTSGLGPIRFDGLAAVLLERGGTGRRVALVTTGSDASDSGQARPTPRR